MSTRPEKVASLAQLGRSVPRTGGRSGVRISDGARRSNDSWTVTGANVVRVYILMPFDSDEGSEATNGHWLLYGEEAHLAEQLLCKQKVVGSTPIFSTVSIA